MEASGFPQEMIWTLEGRVHKLNDYEKISNEILHEIVLPKVLQEMIYSQ